MKFTTYIILITGRVLFIIGLLFVMATPQLTSENPSGLFKLLSAFTTSISTSMWMLVGLGVVAVVFVASWLTYINSREKASGMHPIQQMTIEEAVSVKKGGNGLASQAFPLRLAWLGLLGWVEVEPDKECMVVDGQRVIWKTSLQFLPMRLLGKPTIARRVLLAPEPQEIPSVEALSSDQWNAKMNAKIILRVKDPLLVRSEKPLEELKQMAQGVIAEHIRTHKRDILISDTGALRQALGMRLREQRALQGLEIIDVPNAVTVDERVIETHRREIIERATADLVQRAGENKLTEAEYADRIARLNADLEESLKDLEHQRDMERRQLEARAMTLQGVITAVGQIAASGLDPSNAIKEIKDLVLPSEPAPTPGPPPAQPAISATSRLTTERQMMSESQSDLGILEFSITPNVSDPNSPGEAHITFPNHILHIVCSADYPAAAPTVQVETNHQTPVNIAIPWSPTYNLVMALTFALTQLDT